jgi:hypothetical protein
MKRITFTWLAVILAGTMASLARAQNSTAQSSTTQDSTTQPSTTQSWPTQDSAPPEPSLGDYARSVRKDKAPASAKQFDNDNLPVDDKLSVVGGAEAADNGQAAANGGPDAGQSDKKADDKPGGIKPGESAEDRQKTYDAWKDRLDAQKAKTDLLSRELDVEQREYQLRAAAMYADAGNRLRNSGTWDKEDADYKKKIDEKKKAVDAAKEELDNMQEDARKAGVPSSVRESAGQQ